VHDGLVDELSRDYGVHAYGKWRGAFWRLLSLVDLGVQPGHPGVVAAAEKTLEWVADPERLAEVRALRIDGPRAPSHVAGRPRSPGLPRRGDER
jgi:hypothetical protein